MYLHVGFWVPLGTYTENPHIWFFVSMSYEIVNIVVFSYSEIVIFDSGPLPSDHSKHQSVSPLNISKMRLCLVYLSKESVVYKPPSQRWLLQPQRFCIACLHWDNSMTLIISSLHWIPASTNWRNSGESRHWTLWYSNKHETKATYNIFLISVFAQRG
jgi:hypothetical protein